MSWEQWVQDVTSSVLNKAAEAKFTQPYEIDKLRLQALGNLGQFYQEGMPLTQGRQGISQGTLILLGLGALVAVFVLKD